MLPTIPMRSARTGKTKLAMMTLKYPQFMVFAKKQAGARAMPPTSSDPPPANATPSRESSATRPRKISTRLTSIAPLGARAIQPRANPSAASTQLGLPYTSPARARMSGSRETLQLACCDPPPVTPNTLSLTATGCLGRGSFSEATARKRALSRGVAWLRLRPIGAAIDES